ncbi:MAG: L,D-transpeptidase [Kiritimatiellia bacterium]
MQPLIQIQNLKALQERFPEEAEIWCVDVDRQRISRIRPPDPTEHAPVSTSRFGLGNIPGSLKTPLGAHRVCEIIGAGAPPGQPFQSREPSGTPLSKWTGGTGDAILTRILWLEGLIPGFNDQSRNRFIYVHGTHQEEKLGTPASQGCIRMANEVIAHWSDELRSPSPLVWIGHVRT